MSQTISVMGCGWLGLPLSQSLLVKGNRINGSTTSESKLIALKELGIKPYLMRLVPESTAVEVADFFESSLCVINLPPRNQSDNDRYHYQQLLFIKKMLINSGVKKVIFVSSTSVYLSENRIVTEEDASYLAKSRAGISLLKMEDIFRNESKLNATIIRFSGLIGPNRHPGKFFSPNREYSGGNIPVNLIHLDDCIGVIEHIITQDIWGKTYNANTPDHPTKSAFYTHAAKLLNKKPPSFRTDGDYAFKTVSSASLIASGYEFKHQHLFDAI